MRWATWLRCKLGLHEGSISCDIKLDTVSYRCRFCPYVQTDPISFMIWRELDDELDRRITHAHANAAASRNRPGDHPQA